MRRIGRDDTPADARGRELATLLEDDVKPIAGASASLTTNIVGAWGGGGDED